MNRKILAVILMKVCNKRRQSCHAIGYELNACPFIELYEPSNEISLLLPLVQTI